jgi:phosphonate transport system substrate-binding protein
MKHLIIATLLAGVALLSACEQTTPTAKGPEYDVKPSSVSTDTVYRFAIHPLHNPQKLFAVYTPLMEYLNRRVPGVIFEVEASNSYPHYETKLQAREPEFVLPNPYQTLKALDWGYDVLAEAGNSSDFKGIFIARKDSRITKPEDLHGKVIAYPAATALAAAMMPQQWLAENGLPVMQAAKNEYVGSQESSILNAYHQKSAVSATWPPPWRAFQQDHPKEAAGLKVLWETPPLINNSVMVRNDIPKPLANQVREVLHRMHEDPEGAAILYKMHTAAFYPADNARYRSTVGGFLTQYTTQVGPLP